MRTANHGDDATMTIKSDSKTAAKYVTTLRSAAAGLPSSSHFPGTTSDLAAELNYSEMVSKASALNMLLRQMLTNSAAMLNRADSLFTNLEISLSSSLLYK